MIYIAHIILKVIEQKMHRVSVGLMRHQRAHCQTSKDNGQSFMVAGREKSKGTPEEVHIGRLGLFQHTLDEV